MSLKFSRGGSGAGLLGVVSVDMVFKARSLDEITKGRGADGEDTRTEG